MEPRVIIEGRVAERQDFFGADGKPDRCRLLILAPGVLVEVGGPAAGAPVLDDVVRIGATVGVFRDQASFRIVSIERLGK